MQGPTEADIRWAKKHGWAWDGEAFSPEPVIKVIPNPQPQAAKCDGWCPWLPACGALQVDAPYGSVRAALRVAEEIRQQRRLGVSEMNCSEEAP